MKKERDWFGLLIGVAVLMSLLRNDFSAGSFFLLMSIDREVRKLSGGLK